MLIRDQIKRIVYLSLYAVYTRAKMMLIPLILVPILVLVISSTAKKQYINHATILIEESALLNPFLDDLSFSFELKDRMDALRTLVISRKVLAAVAQEVNLVPENATDLEIDKMQKKLANALSLSLVGDELVRIHFRWTNREQMKPVLEAVIEKFIERLLAPTKTSLDTSEQFFSQQLDVLRAELEKSEDQLAHFKSKNSDSLPELFSSNRGALESLEVQKQQKSVELSGAKARLDALSNKLGKANPILGILENKIIITESEVSLLRTRYTDKHSQVQAKLRMLDNLKIRQSELMAQNTQLDTSDMDKLWQMANTLPAKDGNTENNLLVTQLVALQEAKNNVMQIERELEMLMVQIKDLSGRLSSTSGVEKELKKLERDHEVKQLLYREMLSRYEMAKITGKLVRYEGPDKVKTIERAFSPTSAINTPLIVILFIGIGLGVLAGGASIFLSFLCDSSIQDIDSIEKTTGLKVISVMPIIEDNSILEPNQISIESNTLN